MLNTKQIRAMRQNGDFDTTRHDISLWQKHTTIALLAIIILLIGIITAHASEPVNIERLANSIYMAEGGAKTRHPYGILAKYKTTTPRQACINTIKTNIRKWNKAGMTGSYKEFIVFMSKTYCPVGAKNDPTGLNKHWVKNTTYYYERG